MDEPGGYYAKWNKSDRERQIPYDFTYWWNLKNKTNKQNKTKWKQTHRNTEQRGGCQRERGSGVGMGICKKAFLKWWQKQLLLFLCRK